MEFPDSIGGKRCVVERLDLTVSSGKTTAIVGESGSGKSVTALSIMRLIAPPGKITCGAIVFDSQDLRTLSDYEIRKVRGRRIAMIFQEPMTSLNPVYTIGEQIIETIMQHQRIDRSAAQVVAVNAMKEVGIQDASSRLRSYPHQFSGGMRQRVMIAMALACQPQLLIADEPTTALDVTIQAQILQMLRTIQQTRGMSIILITHDLGIVAQHADQVYVMYAGHVVERAAALELFRNPLHPYTRALIRCKPGLREKRHRLETVGINSTGESQTIVNSGNETLHAWWPGAASEHRMHTAGEDHLVAVTADKRPNS